MDQALILSNNVTQQLLIPVEEQSDISVLYVLEDYTLL